MLVGKGITYDTGGIDIKPNDAMQLMRKDMGGAATVVGALLAAAELGLPVRVTTLAPLAENMLSGSAWRSGDVVRHYGGLTSEVHSTDAEGRVVLGDAMAYAVAQPRARPAARPRHADRRVADRAGQEDRRPLHRQRGADRRLHRGGAAAGEQLWRLPLAEDYAKDVAADIADLNNAAGNPGAITAALYLREFAGQPARPLGAHRHVLAVLVGRPRRRARQGRDRLGRTHPGPLALHGLLTRFA